MATMRERGWRMFDAIVADAPRRAENPWCLREGQTVYEPAEETLQRLLGVPIALGASSQSGVPALAIDVWVAYEFRRAGFHPDRVWPRADPPRVLSWDVIDFVARLPAQERERVTACMARAGTGGAASANVMGKNYVKQVDVVMSSWATGPELLVSTKRMDSSFGKNAANRVEESYGDAKNLRLRHPQAALGYVFALSAIALETEKDTAVWLIDLLGKLGREDDAYDAVALLLPDLTPGQEAPGEEQDAAGPLDAGAVDPTAESLPSHTMPLDASSTADDLASLPHVSLYREGVPPSLEPGRFFAVMCGRILDNSPVNFHVEARARRDRPRRTPEAFSGTSTA